MEEQIVFPGCYSSQRVGPIHSSHGSLVAVSGAFDKDTPDESNQRTILNVGYLGTSRRATSSFTSACSTRNELHLSTCSSAIKWLTPISRKLLRRCYSSQRVGPMHASQGCSIVASCALGKIVTDACNQRTSPSAADLGTSPRVTSAFTSAFSIRNGLHLSTRSSAIKWRTPISGKILKRCFSSDRVGPVPTSQGSSKAVLDALDKVIMAEPNQHAILNDFDWHEHMAMGSFLYKGELILTIRTTSLQEYSLKNPMIEERHIYGDPNGKTFVKDLAKGHIWKLINSLSEFHRIGLCIVDLDHTKVVMCDGVAKFAPDISFVAATDDLIQENFTKLEKVIRGTLFQRKQLPYDMNKLLKIMRTEAIKSMALMKCHVSLVRQVHKTAFYMRMYDFVDALRLMDYEPWLLLLSFLPYKYAWLKIMLGNKLLFVLLMRKRAGQLSDPAKEVAFLLRMLECKISDPAKLVHTYRSLSTHKMDDSVDPVTGEVLYTEQMFEDILDSELPMYKTDMQHGLHKVCKIELARLDSFFGRTDSVGSCNNVKELLLPKNDGKA